MTHFFPCKGEKNCLTSRDPVDTKKKDCRDGVEIRSPQICNNWELFIQSIKIEFDFETTGWFLSKQNDLC